MFTAVQYSETAAETGSSILGGYSAGGWRRMTPGPDIDWWLVMSADFTAWTAALLPLHVAVLGLLKVFVQTNHTGC